MKKILSKIQLAILALIGFSACSQVDYDGEYSKDGFYVGDNKVAFAFTAVADTTQAYSFGLKSLDTLTHTSYIRVKLVGNLSQQDREFKIVADPSSTAKAGVHYTALPDKFVLPANTSLVRVPIELIRKDMNKAGSDSLTLVLQLVPTNDFKTNLTQFVRLGDYDQPFVYTPKMKIVFDNKANAPSYWEFFQSYYSLPPFTLKRYLYLQELLDNKLDEYVNRINANDFDAMGRVYMACQQVAASGI